MLVSAAPVHSDPQRANERIRVQVAGSRIRMLGNLRSCHRLCCTCMGGLAVESIGSNRMFMSGKRNLIRVRYTVGQIYVISCSISHESKRWRCSFQGVLLVKVMSEHCRAKIKDEEERRWRTLLDFFPTMTISLLQPQ